MYRVYSAARVLTFRPQLDLMQAISKPVAVSLSVYHHLTKLSLAELNLDAFTAFSLVKALPYNDRLQTLKLDQVRAGGRGSHGRTISRALRLNAARRSEPRQAASAGSIGTRVKQTISHQRATPLPRRAMSLLRHAPRTIIIATPT